MTIRPALRPGAALLRRDATHLQIGTSPGLVLRDRPGLFSVLRLFDGIRDLALINDLTKRHIGEFEGDVVTIVHELISAGAVFDSRDWDFAGNGRLSNEARSARLGGASTTHLGRRDDFRVRLLADRPTRELARAVGQILASAGVTPARSDDSHLVVMLSHGEPARHRIQLSMESRTDHLRVVVDEDHVRIGPLVRPGQSPCINCHDLHRTDWDGAWPALMTQFGASSSSPPAPNATTLHVAAAAIAAEVLGDCDGAGTETVGQCVMIGPHFRDHQSWPVSFHPDCGCILLAA